MTHIKVMMNEPGEPPTHPEDAARLVVPPEGVFTLMGESDVTAILLIGGMESGKSSVTLRVQKGDTTVWFETSLAMLAVAVQAMLAMDRP